MAKQNKITLIFGRKGSGKTCLAKSLIPKLKPPIIILDSQDEYEGGVIFHQVEHFIDLYLNEKIKPGIFIFRLSSDEQIDALFITCWLLGNLTIIGEEIDLYCSAYAINNNLEKIIKYGRHRNINLIAISRRPAEVSRLISAQADEVYIFKTMEPRDLQYFSTFGVSASNLTSLKDYQNIHLTF